MTTRKASILLATLVFTNFVSAHDQVLDKEIREQASAVQEALKKFRSALTSALSFDIDKALSPPLVSSREQSDDAYFKALARMTQLTRYANKYLKTSTRWKQQMLAGERAELAKDAEVQTLRAKVDKVDTIAVAALEYAKTVFAFQDALETGQSGDAELERVPAARRRLLDSIDARK